MVIRRSDWYLGRGLFGEAQGGGAGGPPPGVPGGRGRGRGRNGGGQGQGVSDLSGAQGFSASSPSSAPVNSVATNYGDVEWQDASDFNATTGLYTVPTDGTYLIALNNFPAGGINSPSAFAAEPYINGSNQLSGRMQSRVATSNHGNSAGFVAIHDLSAGDTVGVFSNSDAGSGIFFSMLRLDTLVDTAWGGWRWNSSSGSNGNPIGAITSATATTGFDASIPEFEAQEDGNYFLYTGTVPTNYNTADKYSELRIDGTAPSTAYTPDVVASGSPSDTSGGGHFYATALNSGQVVQPITINDAVSFASFCGFRFPSNPRTLVAPYKSGGVNSGNTVTSWDDVRFPTVGSGWDASTGVFTAPKAGIYFVSAFSSNVTIGAGEIRLGIYKNGTAKARSSIYQNTHAVRNPCTCIAILDLAKDDTVDFRLDGPGNSGQDFNVVIWG